MSQPGPGGSPPGGKALSAKTQGNQPSTSGGGAPAVSQRALTSAAPLFPLPLPEFKVQRAAAPLDFSGTGVIKTGPASPSPTVHPPCAGGVDSGAFHGTPTSDRLVAPSSPAPPAHPLGLSTRPATPPVPATLPPRQQSPASSAGASSTAFTTKPRQRLQVGAPAQRHRELNLNLRLWLHETRKWLMGVGCEAAPYESAEVPWTPHPTTYPHLLKEVRQATVLSQQGVDLDEEEEVYYDYEEVLPRKRRTRVEHRAAAVASGIAPERLAAVREVSGELGFAGDVGSMVRARPQPRYTYVPPRKHGRACEKLRRPTFPAATWRRVHAERCRCSRAARGSELDVQCGFSFIHEALTQGWSLPLAFTPPTLHLDNYPVTEDYREAVTAFLQKLLATDSIAVAEGFIPWLVAPMGVAFRGSDVLKLKPRIVVDESAVGLNFALPAWPFLYVGITDIVLDVKPLDWMSSLDFRAYYTKLALSPRFMTLLGVSWDGVNYVYTSPSFGLSLAPAFASVISSEICLMAMARGVAVAKAYIDDVLNSASSEGSCNADLDLLLQLLKELDVEVAPEKVVRAAQRTVFLGVLYDTVQRRIEVAPGYQERLRVSLREMAVAEFSVPVVTVENVVGRLFWVAQVDMRIRGWARELRHVAKAATSVDETTVTVTPQLRQLSATIADTLEPTLSTPVLAWQPPPGLPVLFRSDASGPYSFGAHWGEKAFARPGSVYDWWAASHNMVQKELCPILHAVNKWGVQWRGKFVVAVTDNEGACMAFNHGHSTNDGTHELVVQLHEAVHHLGIYLVLVHVPREFNIWADFLTHVPRLFDGSICFQGGEIVIQDEE